MRFAVEAWAPDYGAPAQSLDMQTTAGNVDAFVEHPAGKWAPISPLPQTPLPGTVVFTDGVRRVDATVWITAENGDVHPGICASYAAGAVRCDGRASVDSVMVERGLFTAAPNAEAVATDRCAYPVRAAPGNTPESLTLALQRAMSDLEAGLAIGVSGGLVVVDGPLAGRRGLPATVGFIKTHHVRYLAEAQAAVVAQLTPGQRTPIFLTMDNWRRFSWYLRLPGGSGHPWAGIVRCEATADQEVRQVAELADQVGAVLPRFASSPHKDPRAPQNLYPIGGLENILRARLGDPSLIYRSLLLAARRDGQRTTASRP